MSGLSRTYCAQCGTPIEGRFCWRCGAAAHVDADAPATHTGLLAISRFSTRVGVPPAVALTARVRAATTGVTLPDRRTVVFAAAAFVAGICCLAFPVLALLVALSTFVALAMWAAGNGRAERDTDSAVTKAPPE